MAFWSRVRNSQLKLCATRLRSSYFRSIPTSFLSQDSRNPQIEIPKVPSNFFRSGNVRFFAAPVQFQVQPKVEKKEKGPRLNNKIPHETIRLVDQNEEHTVVSRTVALERARGLKLDLVEVDRHADPPVCRLMDFRKEMYQKKVKAKERAKSKVTVKNTCKDVRFSSKCEQKDLVVKANAVKRLMETGYRVKCRAMGTEDQDLAELLSRFTSLIEDLCVIESGPIVERTQAFVVVRHNKFGLKGGKKESKVTADKTTEAPMVTGSEQTPLQFDEGKARLRPLSEPQPQPQPQHPMIVYPSRPRGPAFRSVNASPNEVPIPENSCADPPKPTPSYGIFSGVGASNPRQQQGVGAGMNANMNRNPVDQARLGQQSRLESQARHNLNAFPSRLDGLKCAPNEVTGQEKHLSDPPKTTPSYGIFSGVGASNPRQQQGVGAGMNANMNRNPVDQARLGQQSRPESQARHNLNAFPSRLDGLKCAPNEVTGQERHLSDPAKTTPSYGIFSGVGASNPRQQQGVGAGMNANMNRNPVDQARVGQQSRPQSQARHNLNDFPSRLDGLKCSPNEVTGQEKHLSDPPKPTPSYGIFSSMKTSNPGK